MVVEHQKSKEDVLKRDPDIKTLMALEEVNSKVSITNLPNNCFTPAQSTQTTTQSTWSPLDSPISAMNLAKNSSHEGDKCDQPTLSIVPYSHQFDSRSPASLSPEWNGLTDIYKGTQDELLCNLDDETPDILKDANSPVKMLKTGSPNQKRVSPPRKLQRDGGYSFSPGLKSGRKYVLHSIPQFPSLTPYRNSLIDMEPENQSDLKK